MLRSRDESSKIWGMTLGPEFFVTLLGWVIGLVALYVVIRLAVTHAINATRPQPKPGDAGASAPAHLDSDGL